MTNTRDLAVATTGLVVIVWLAVAGSYGTLSNNGPTIILSTASGQLFGLPPGMRGTAAAYLCDDGRSIRAAFGDAYAHFELSDHREFNVPQVTVADGAKFTNGDESFVFWKKDNAAYIKESGMITYANCTLKATPSAL